MGRSMPIVVVIHVPPVTEAICYVLHQEWMSRAPNLGGLIDSLMVTDASAVVDALLVHCTRGPARTHPCQ